MTWHNCQSAIFGIGLIASSFLVHTAHAQQPSTTRELRALSPRAANRTVQRDLLSVLKPLTAFDSGMLRRLRGVGLSTRPYATEIADICRRDVVTLLYAPVEREAEPEDTGLRPYGIEASPEFHVLRGQVPRSNETDREQSPWQAKCLDLDHKKDTSWFWAKDAFHAAQGVLMFERAIQAVSAGKLKSAPCPEILDPRKPSCEDAIVAVGDISKIDSVESCPAEDGKLCYVIDLESSTLLTIRARGSLAALAPSDILSISIEQYLTVT